MLDQCLLIFCINNKGQLSEIDMEEFLYTSIYNMQVPFDGLPSDVGCNYCSISHIPSYVRLLSPLRALYLHLLWLFCFFHI